jgi:ATP/maltotriose-dependent transcriptional regulator MalT
MKPRIQWRSGAVKPRIHSGSARVTVVSATRPPLEQLSGSEIRVLRYLPTHLSAPEIAGELSVSTSTVETHLRNLYAKLGVHRRPEAVESARTLGLLAPSARPQTTGHPVAGYRSAAAGYARQF